MAENKISYKEVLKESEYRKLLISTIINRFGDSLDAVGFTWLVYQITHSGTWSAIIFALNILPNVIIQPFTGALVERLEKKKVIVVTHFLRGTILIGFLTIYLLGCANGWIMAGFTFLITTIEAFNMPAGNAFLPSVIKKEHMTHGMSLNATLSSAATLVGTGLAGVIIAAAGLKTVMIIDIITFFVAGLIILTIRCEQLEENLEQIKGESYLTTLKEGIRYIRSERVIVNCIIIAVMLNMVLVPINALQAPLVSECYHLGSELLSVIGIAGSIGSILGSIMIPVVSKKLSLKQTLIIFGLLLGLGVMIIPFGGTITDIAMIKFLFAGMCFIILTFTSSLIVGMFNIAFLTYVNPKYLARASSVITSAATAVMPITSLFVGWAKVRIETGAMITVCGIGIIILMIITMLINPELEMKKGITNEVKVA
ncbi:Transmembrane secretion effector [Lachnospiraceae bacterium]|nr:Transmembrane secretion effector [Lachnospiraceae bacterium]